METAKCEVTRVQRAMRDLVALCALPAVWARFDQAGIANNLAAVLLHMLDLDFVFVSLRVQGSGPDWQRLLTREIPLSAAQQAEACRKLAGRLQGISTRCVLTVPDPFGAGEVRLAVIPLGGQGECGTLAAACDWRPDFPTELDSLLLGIGANQAAVVLQVRREDEALSRLAAIVESSSDAIIGASLDGVIQSWNASAQRLYGYTAAEARGQSLALLLAPESVPDWPGLLRQLDDAQRSAPYETVHVRKDRKRIEVSVSISPIKNAAGNLAGASAVIRDVGERKRMERVLRQSEERQQTLSEYLADVTCVARINEKGEPELESVSDNFTNLSGYTLQELNSRGGVPFAIHPDDTLLALRTLEQVLAGVGAKSEIRMIRKDGEQRWIRYLAQPEWDADEGRVVRIRALAQDVTERKAALQIIEESERRFRQLAENIHEVFWLSDPPRSQILYVSPAYETIWGRSCRSLYDNPLSFLEAIRAEDRPAVVANFEKQGLGQVTSIEYRITRPDGDSRWILDRSFPVRDEAGQIWRVAGIAEDISERKRAEEALREADRRKDEFLATLAHELRNPLAPIRNSIHVMRLRGLDDPQLQWSRDVIERQVRQMTRLIDDLLDVSRITRGKVELRKEVVDLARIVNQAVETTRPLFADRRQELTLSLPNASLTLKADPTRLEQILANLLNNAAKYTEPGGRVWLTAAREGSNVVIRVRDNGIGIPSDLLGRVFDMFVQGDQGNDRARGGLGIGLSLVRTLVEMHGGIVAAHSAGLGTGSEFVVWLPLHEGMRDEG